MLNWVEHENSFITSGPVFKAQSSSFSEIDQYKAHLPQASSFGPPKAWVF